MTDEMVENCCKSLYASPRVRQTGFEMQAWSGACKEDGEQNETTIAIKSQMADLEVRPNFGQSWTHDPVRRFQVSL